VTLGRVIQGLSGAGEIERRVPRPGHEIASASPGWRLKRPADAPESSWSIRPAPITAIIIDQETGVPSCPEAALAAGRYGPAELDPRAGEEKAPAGGPIWVP
jgi:hypothetical protein